MKLLSDQKICGSALEAVAGAQHRAGGLGVDEDKRRKGKGNNQPVTRNGPKLNWVLHLLKI